MHRDTIVAVATGSVDAALAVIRLSGTDAWRLVRGLAADLPERPRARRATLRALRDGEVQLDRALVLPFVAPASFTGEDVVELHVHGGQVGVGRIVRALVERGARPAEPGEFTRRALENGKLDLLEAEGIAELVRAQSESAWAVGQDLLAGRLSRRAMELRDELASILVLVEAGLDFAGEEHVYQAPIDELRDRLAKLVDELEALLGTWRDGRIRVDGLRVAIVGRPNAGKSTLFNLLHGDERALVSEQAGTTRDWIEERVELGGLLVRLVDTAGQRETSDRVEAMGVERARAVAAKSDALVLVVDACEADASRALYSARADGQPVALVWNKVDRPEAEEVPGWARDSLVVRTSLTAAPEAARSALTEMLLGLARRAGWTGREASAVLVRERQRDAVREARDAAVRAVGACVDALPLEMVAVDVRASLDALGGLVGAVTSEDVLQRVFAEFCVGK